MVKNGQKWSKWPSTPDAVWPGPGAGPDRPLGGPCPPKTPPPPQEKTRHITQKKLTVKKKMTVEKMIDGPRLFIGCTDGPGSTAITDRLILSLILTVGVVILTVGVEASTNGPRSTAITDT